MQLEHIHKLEVQARASAAIAVIKKQNISTQVESRKLKHMLIPVTEEKMDQMKTLVKDLARSKCKEQLVKYTSWLSTIAQKPTHLKEFAG